MKNNLIPIILISSITAIIVVVVLKFMNYENPTVIGGGVAGGVTGAIVGAMNKKREGNG